METIAALIIGIPLILYSYLFVAQESFIFRPQPLTTETIEEAKKETPLAEEVTLITPDKTTLHGWFVRPDLVKPNLQKPATTPVPLIIYFGGNSEEITWFTSISKNFEGFAVATLNYRGFGKSTGKAGESEFFRDSEFIYDTFSKLPEIDATKIIIMGRSIGTCVAVHLSANRKILGTVLLSPLDSMKAVASKHMPFVPVGTLLRHNFNSLELAPKVKTPLFTLIAEDDKIVPPKHSLRLADAWQGVVRIKKYKDTHHNNIIHAGGLWDDINKFIQELYSDEFFLKPKTEENKPEKTRKE
ncbi:MAG: alpha/beta hydrolase [Deltaproteobacteria bacterium]|nr:alpha/beta hydrolase [Deltaproteobacteria bacterium]